ncbi:bacteriophage antitermination protein Q, partial [Salmonella enterica]
EDLQPFFADSRVINAAGGQEGLKTWVGRMAECQCVVWLQMHDRLRLLGKRVTNDMTGNLITLAGFVVWNAGQIMSGKDNAEIFAATYAAQEINVGDKAWRKSYKKHWEFMRDKCTDLDYDALKKLMRKI